MMESLFWIFVLFGPATIEAFYDPGLGFNREPEQTRRHDCISVDVDTAREIRPDDFGNAYPRGDFFNREAFLCREQIIEPGLRAPQTERLVNELSRLVSDLATRIQSEYPQINQWMVEVHYEDPVVGHKIDFATKVALSELGLGVSDRVPNLRPTDLGVIGRLSHSKAHDLACRRLTDDGQIGDSEALLNILVLDPRQTDLIAGVCTDGNWSWVQ
ncbi:MAG: hypothetical protein VX210_12005 [Myxococcota bacterium]|nr:hypothetical protein [Myxococcota bacterium]